MLNLPYVNQIGKNISSIDTFLGLNKGFKIGENELSESYNMCSEDYPVLSTRKRRHEILINGEESDPLVVQGGFSSVVITNDILVVLTRNGDLYYDDKKIELGIKNNKLLRIGNMLYAYPSGTLIKLPNNKDGEITTEITHTKLQFVMPTDDDQATGIIDESGTFVGYVIFQPAISSGIGKTSYYFQPTEPKVGDYCYFNTGNGYTLNMWGDVDSGDMGWITVEPDCIRVITIISTNDKEKPVDSVWFKNVFKVGDAVFVSGTNNEKTDRSFIVEAFGDADDPAMYLSGYLTTDHIATGCIVEKKMPENLDFVIEHNNRLWGCFCGYDSAGNFYNEIYATAQNDPTNWYRYDGTSSQSYTISVVSDGRFTGAAVINGYVTFFKERCMHRVYGNSPADFQLVAYECAGIQEGCERSFAGYNGVYFYKSNIGIMRISDGYPVLISDKLGNDVYFNAIGGIDGKCYYVQMNDSNKEHLFVFDIQKGIWHCENNINNLNVFFNYKNNLFCMSEQTIEKPDPILDALYSEWLNATGLKKQLLWLKYLVEQSIRRYYSVNFLVFSKSETINIMLPKFGSTSNAIVHKESEFAWQFETGNLAYSYFLTKYVDKLCVRAMVDEYARVNVEILYDSEGEWSSVTSIIGDGTVKTHIIPIRPNQCDHYKLRFSGIGDIKILNVIIKYIEGGDNS